MNTMSTIRPNTYTSVPQFGQKFRHTLQAMAGSLFDINGPLDRFDRVQGGKVFPVYEKIFADFLHLRFAAVGRENRSMLKDVEKSLTTVLDEKGFSKTGGLLSPYWQAYHWPAMLFDGRENMGDFHKFVKEDYIPLLEGIDQEKGWWALISILQALNDASDSTTETVAYVRELGRIQKEQPDSWQATEQLMKAFWQQAEVFYIPPLYFSESQRESLYKIARNDFVQDVIKPWLDKLSETGKPHEVTAHYLDTVLPEVLGRLGEDGLWQMKGPDGLSGFIKYFSGVKADILETLWRVRVLDADLKNNDLPDDVSEQFRANIVRLRKEAGNTEETEYTGPELPISHCNLAAVVPRQFDRKV